MICRYQRPAKCCRATMTIETTTKAPKRILVRQFTSRSNRPICGRSKRLTVSRHGPQPAELALPRGLSFPAEDAALWLEVRTDTQRTSENSEFKVLWFFFFFLITSEDLDTETQEPVTSALGCPALCTAPATLHSGLGKWLGSYTRSTMPQDLWVLPGSSGHPGSARCCLSGHYCFNSYAFIVMCLPCKM